MLRRMATSVVGSSSCFRKNHLAGYMRPIDLAVLEHGEVAGDHLLLPVVGHLHRSWRTV